MTIKKVMFILSCVHRDFRKAGAIPANELALLNDVAVEADVDADIVLAVEAVDQAGEGSKISMKVVREERDRLLQQIEDANPDLVMALGPVPVKSLFDKGNMVMKELMRQHHEVDGVSAPVIVSHSLENIAAQPGLKQWLRMDLMAAVHGYTDTEWGKYEYIRSTDLNWDVCHPVYSSLEAQSVIGFDLETFPGLSPWDKGSRIRMAILSLRPGNATVVLCDKYGRLPQWVQDVAADPTICKAGSNVKFDYRWMHRFGYKLVNMHDTSTADHIIDETNPLKDLKSLTFKYLPRLGDYSKGQRELVKSRGGWEHVTDEEMLQYAGGDGEASVAAALAQRETLKAQGLERPFKLSMDLYKVLADMECKGARISRKVNRELDEEFSEHLVEVREKITGALGPINPNSPAQLDAALVEAVPGIDLRKRGVQNYFEERDTEAASTARDVLEREAHKSGVIQDILLYRRLQKLHSTYVVSMHDKYMLEHNGETFIHPSYRTDVTATNRLASSAPNGQNIPRKPDPDDPHPIPAHLNIKRQFISRFPGGSIMEADLSQAELRIAAWLSKDPAMLEIINAGGDIHRNTASIVYSIPVDDVTSFQRQACKKVNFLTLYGGGTNTLSRQLGITKVEAKHILDAYFEAFPRLRRYIDRVHARVKVDLQIESPFGYRRRFVRPRTWNCWDGWKVQRQAFNMLIQNTAAAYCYVGMIGVADWMQSADMKSCTVMQVHDSIVIDAHPDEIEILAKVVKNTLEHPFLARAGVHDFDVPMVCDVEAGDSWGTMRRLEC